MVKQFEDLTEEEQELLFRAPVLVSVMSSCSYNNVNHLKKEDAIKLSHIKTFTADPMLIPYYREVEKSFKEKFEATVAKYFPFDHDRRQELLKEINKVSTIIGRLDNKFATTLRRSLDLYAKHVRNAHSVIRDFMFPIPIQGLTT
jgi:hypothetical protein